ncbi:MAG: tetratricopeptide repeat protein [Phycisphaerae bacterium]
MNKGLSTAVTLFAAVVFIHGCTQSNKTVVQSQKERNWLEADSAAISAAQEIDAPRILPKTHFAAALLFEQNGQWQKAVAQYQKAVAVNHQYVEAYAHMGMLLGRLGRHSEAEIALRRAVQLKPDSARMRNNLGYEYALQKRWMDAEAELNNAIELKPDFARAYINLGLVLAKQQRFEEALESFNAALPDADAYYNLGLMYRSAQRHRDAADAFRHVLALNPNFPAAARQLEETEAKIQPMPVPDPVMVADADTQPTEPIATDTVDQDIVTVDSGEPDAEVSSSEATLASNEQLSMAPDDPNSGHSLIGSAAPIGDEIVESEGAFGPPAPTLDVAEPEASVPAPSQTPIDPMVSQPIDDADGDTTAPPAPADITEPIVDDGTAPMATIDSVTAPMAGPVHRLQTGATAIDADDSQDETAPEAEVTAFWTHDPTEELLQDDPSGQDSDPTEMSDAQETGSAKIGPAPTVDLDDDPVMVDRIDVQPTVDEVTPSIPVEPVIVEATPVQPIDAPLPVDDMATDDDLLLNDRSAIESYVDDDILDWILADGAEQVPCPDDDPGVDTVDGNATVLSDQDVTPPQAADNPVGFPLWLEASKRATERRTARLDGNAIELAPTQDDSSSRSPIAAADDEPAILDLHDVSLWHWAQQTARWMDRFEPAAEQASVLTAQEASDPLAEVEQPAEAYLNWPSLLTTEDDDFNGRIGIEGVLSAADAINMAIPDNLDIDPMTPGGDEFVVDLTASETVLVDASNRSETDSARPCPAFNVDLVRWEARFASVDMFGWGDPFDAYAVPPSMTWFAQQIPLIPNDTIPMPEPSVSMESSDTDLPPYFQDEPSSDVDGMMLFPNSNTSWMRPQ